MVVMEGGVESPQYLPTRPPVEGWALWSAGLRCGLVTCVGDGGVIKHGHVVEHAARTGLQVEDHPGELDHMAGGARYHPPGKAAWKG